MTDITSIFSSFLIKHPATAPIAKSQPPPAPTDEFLKEAYRIAQHIKAVHQNLQATKKPYLSTARPPVSRTLSQSTSTTHLTDAQRDALDGETKSVIRSTLSFISRLETAEKIRVQTGTQLLARKHSSLRSLFADDAIQEAEEAAMRVTNAHREAVIWFLKNRLEQVSEEQRERQEIRLQRQIERGKSLLHRMPPNAAAQATASKVALQEEQEMAGEGGLTPDQLRIFEKENEGMLKHYEDTLEQVRTAESSLLEISELQTQLAMNLVHQNVHIDNLMQDSMATEDNMQRGNKELKKAAEKASLARTAFFASVGFASVVFIWDWFI
ncbi:hypothetical protein EDC01DRAFT_662738 [Geopyxis carbonaria]|nr:hypothetical protein EDC01DRAFT_662738 [Geopyxis carbonaria]